MDQKNKKILITLLIALILIVIVSFMIVSQRTSDKVYSPTQNTEEAKEEVGKKEVPTSGLDEFVQSQKNFLDPKRAQNLHLDRMEVAVPVETKEPVKKITIVPQLISGGDAVYEPVVEMPDGKFFVLQKSAMARFFKINTPEEASRYLDFVEVKMGSSAYDRIKTTIFSRGDYRKKDCKDKKEVVTQWPITQARSVEEGFEVDWVYYTPAAKAGYWKKTYFVSRDGDIQLKKNPAAPFWECGPGMVF